MKNTRKLFCALLAAALLILSVVPAFAEDEISVDNEAETIYLKQTEKADYATTSSFGIFNAKKTTKVTDVKSSKKSVVSINYVEKYQNSSEYTYYDPSSKSTSTSYSWYIGVKINNPGKATISFKIDGKTYKKTYTVLGYVNPVKTLQITGINSKNLKSAFAKSYRAETKLSGKAKAGNLVVAAAKGWKLTSIEWEDYSDWSSREYRFGVDGVASAKMAIPAMKTNVSYYITARFKNIETGATQYVYYYIQGQSSNKK